MDRSLGYVVALLIAVGVTGMVALTSRSPTLLFGIFGTYSVTAWIVLRYPVLVWGDATPSVPSGVFAGGATFGGLMLAQGTEANFDLAAAVLGLGLAGFGLATGYWMADDNDASGAAT
ncbi:MULTISPECIES: hypothetical protein [Halorubrum]|uniref:Uncharacterized protein n=1 Tax=Halorubrum hochstenium ATCC 700873 TaxID=1227481 RepID=M0F619_9EURY|nr:MULTISPECIES: hypothetical protein [Halorubrum]ELZ54059.1 hypothetical protein C467_12427 [Halorubrum hochstenium ATCC 700873]